MRQTGTRSVSAAWKTHATRVQNCVYIHYLPAFLVPFFVRMSIHAYTHVCVRERTFEEALFGGALQPLSRAPILVPVSNVRFGSDIRFTNGRRYSFVNLTDFHTQFYCTLFHLNFLAYNFDSPTILIIK